uniref:non-specific serine/threonine protein kinase n=1 Tax=Nelumbo nucifera TaxID=4432 RepID=A0A822ZPW9_NELNU|nr:TPA_asm: hypothetical protein HUJ06_003629 [Nelumbo nucifera]
MALCYLRSLLLQAPKLRLVLFQFFFISFLLLIPSSGSLYFIFSGSDNKSRNILKLDGNASFNGNGVTLTVDQPSLGGRAAYKDLVRIWDKQTTNLADFTTRFMITIASTSNCTGDGFAFFLLTPSNDLAYQSEAGNCLGLVSNNRFAADGWCDNRTENQLIAVEFDTYYNTNWDPPYNHVGIDVHSVESVATASWNSTINNNGSTIDARITYNSSTHNLSVFLTYDKKPASSTPDLSHTIDMRDILPEWVLTGFSAATGGCTEQHELRYWEFNSSLEVEVSNGGANSTLLVGLLVGAGSLMGLLGMTWFIIRMKTKGDTEEMEDALFDDDSMNDEFEKGAGPKRFLFGELSRATNNFDAERKLGEGGFGGVYRGFLSDVNLEVAIKRVSKRSQQGIKEYMSEVKIISRLRHKNLVQLVGWCHQRNEFLLVYEFMTNGSLDSHLFGQKESLTWQLRYNIALGLASALLYLHEEWEQCVMHRDIKSSNVMLDSSFNAKLGDFGLARLVDHGQQAQTTVLAGTMGYMAPECVATGKSSKESDVYSFGIVALEIACGRRPVEPWLETNKVRLIEWVWELYGREMLVEGIDPRLTNMGFDEKQLECLMVVGLWCAHPDSNLRPSIKQAMQVLSFQAPLPNLPPKMPVPIYCVPQFSVRDSSNSSSDAVFSNNSSTASLLYPR